jgi:3-oxoacid CoA-transferase subunit A
MIKYWLVSGDTHAQCARFDNIDRSQYPPEETAIIILGDGGNNYYLDERDERLKRTLSRLGYTFYYVRGNHEARPSDLGTMTLVYDEDVQGMVYMEPIFPRLLYFIDGETYHINGKRTIVIGGAYSVDKEYRLMRGWQWFHNEQLDEEERDKIFNKLNEIVYDLVLSHTCPLSWEPRELFLSMIDQSKVDKSMEIWLDEVEKKIDYNFWLFGHFHGNKIINNNAAMLFDAIIDLSMVQPFDKYTDIPEGFYTTFN